MVSRNYNKLESSQKVEQPKKKKKEGGRGWVPGALVGPLGDKKKGEKKEGGRQGNRPYSLETYKKPEEGRREKKGGGEGREGRKTGNQLVTHPFYPIQGEKEKKKGKRGKGGKGGGYRVWIVIV